MSVGVVCLVAAVIAIVLNVFGKCPLYVAVAFLCLLEAMRVL